MLSMTGHGSATLRQRDFDIEVGIRSVNHRFFNLKVSLPEGLAGNESEVERLVRERVRRGSVTVMVALKKIAGHGPSLPSAKTVRGVYRGLRKIQKELNIPGEVTIEALLGIPHLWVSNGRESDLSSVWPVVRKLVTAALDDHARMRAREGRGIRRFLGQRLAAIEKHLAWIQKRAPKVTEAYQKRLLERVNTIRTDRGVEIAGRELAREVAIFADRSDISEEAQRIGSHCRQFRKILAQAGPMGRKLDFLTQELVREANTLAAKGSDSGISGRAVEIKSEIEKIKEQVENVE